MVCREFARQVLDAHPGIVYLNREDDMGRENLRSAKQSYYPSSCSRSIPRGSPDKIPGNYSLPLTS